MTWNGMEVEVGGRMEILLFIFFQPGISDEVHSTVRSELNFNLFFAFFFLFYYYFPFVHFLHSPLSILHFNMYIFKVLCLFNYPFGEMMKKEKKCI